MPRTLSLCSAMMLLALFASVARAACGDTTPQSGGLPCTVDKGPCCDCLDTPGLEKCMWDVEYKWCTAPLLCDSKTLSCVTPPSPVVDQSGGCGAVGEKCCGDGECTGALACASGSCVDTSGDVNEQSVCGLEATECCGYYEDCDEGLVCLDKVCATEDSQSL